MAKIKLRQKLDGQKWTSCMDEPKTTAAEEPPESTAAGPQCKLLYKQTPDSCASNRKELCTDQRMNAKYSNAPKKPRKN